MTNVGHLAPELDWSRLADEQLKRMLASPVFQRAARPARFLEYLVGRWIENPNRSVSEKDVAEAVYLRREFDPKLDPIVRVEGARLRRRIQEYYETEGNCDPVEIRLPQRGYTPEITLRSGNHKPTVVQAADAQPSSGTSLAEGSVMSLAVLPFANLTTDTDLAVFCQGLTEEVTACVTDLSNISVVARTSALQYEGEPVDVRNVGKDLGVTHILEGTVRKHETLIRVTAKLVDAGTGFTTWSKTFEVDAQQGEDPITQQATLGGMIAETLADRAPGGDSGNADAVNNATTSAAHA